MRDAAPHLLYLDLVRALAAQAVVLGHAAVLAFPELIGAEKFHIQSYAVVIFLALSGFLIARSVRSRIARGTFALSGYVYDRAARIFVPLLPLIPCIVIIDHIVLGSPPTSRFVTDMDDGPLAIVSNALMLQDNWLIQVTDRLFDADLSRRALGSAAPWWTVAIEWWIYIAFGCIAALMIRRTQRIAAASIFGGFALVSVLGTSLGGNMLIVAWVIGAALAWWSPDFSASTWRWIAGASILLVVAYLLVLPDGTYTLPVVALTAVAVVASFRSSSWQILQRIAGPIRWLADYSYSLYLIHFSVLVWVVSASPGTPGWAHVAIGVVASNVVAIGCWLAFERHHKAIRAKFPR